MKETNKIPTVTEVMALADRHASSVSALGIARAQTRRAALESAVLSLHSRIETLEAALRATTYCLEWHAKRTGFATADTTAIQEARAALQQDKPTEELK